MVAPDSGPARTLFSADSGDELEIPIEVVFYEAPPGARVRAAAPPPRTPPSPPAPAPPASQPSPPPPAAAPAPPAPPTQLVTTATASPWTALRQVEWRSFRWKTWQLLVVCGVAAVVGMMIGYAALRSGSSSSAKAKPAGATAPTTSPAPAPTTPAPTAPTTAAPTNTTAAGGSAAAAHALLLDLKRETGPLTTQHFTVTGSRWTLGWAYDCTAQGGTGSFKVSIRNADGTPSFDGGIDQQGAKGSSVAAYTTTGERFLAVDTPCLWAVKVTS